MEYILSIAAGIGLSAATGFRIFVPFLVLSLAANVGYLEPAPGFTWLGTPPAVIALAIATLLEIGAYYVPWLDNLLDAVATPAAAVAGTLAAATMFGDMSPMMRWFLAAIAGGGVATMVQTGTVFARATSSLATAGLGNFAVATGELFGALGMTLIAIIFPIVALLLVVLALIWVVRRIPRRRDAHVSVNSRTPS